MMNGSLRRPISTSHGLLTRARECPQRRFAAERSRPSAIGVAVVFLVCAIFAPWIAPQDPAYIDLAESFASRLRRHHWAGTDELGRDILSRLIWGARISMFVGSSVVTGSLALGLIIGSLAGYYGGGIDRFVNIVLMNAFLSFPGILIAIAFVAFRGPGILNLVLALSLGGWVGYARLVRAQVLAVREREFVEAARALGASDLRIILRHILPNIIQPVIVQAAIGMAGAILAEATMSFLGLGVPPPTASWGSMLNDARSHLFDAPHLVLFPAVDRDAGGTRFQFYRRRAARCISIRGRGLKWDSEAFTPEISLPDLSFVAGAKAQFDLNDLQHG